MRGVVTSPDPASLFSQNFDAATFGSRPQQHGSASKEVLLVMYAYSAFDLEWLGWLSTHFCLRFGTSELASAHLWIFRLGQSSHRIATKTAEFGSPLHLNFAFSCNKVEYILLRKNLFAI
jgi:hypothetical protein